MAYNLLGRAKDWELPEAMEQYRKAIEVDPKSADSHHNLGMALASSGNPSKR
jgi:Tfp pilus assembly protein PilF